MSQEASVQTALPCSQCGRAFAPSELVQIAGNWVCGDCKPAFLSRVMASGNAGALARQYGGFWIRFGARFIDGLILGVPFVVAVLLMMPSFFRMASQTGNAAPPANPFVFFSGFFTIFVLGLLAGAAYEILMLKHRSATVGKIACGLKVIRSDGRADLSWGVCFGRYFMWNIVTCQVPYLNVILVPVSGIMLGVDSEKRALHDRVCDTRVIYS